MSSRSIRISYNYLVKVISVRKQSTMPKSSFAVYKCGVATSVDRARSILFGRAHALETLPPTSNALSFHIKRAHYQASIWQ
ncbi:hypothetical protein Hamer_G016583 [Homarus americanus]|uniref:Uncharacterized protein n=1 Tax=Homarus americanus TaxID=6706 RepID=A0A8J5JQE1_HOMAM|nr:hypothetical protein Hamer_G016583 [Homarus americanus]